MDNASPTSKFNVSLIFLAFKKYFEIIKPNIVLANLISIIGGFFLASKGHYNFTYLIYILISMFCIISSSCVLNNYIDIDIDSKMNRTKNRSLVTKSVSLPICISYSIISGSIGFILIYLYSNKIILLLSFVAFFTYIILYSLYMKRKSIHSTLVGSISGAIPPIIGYCSITKNFDLAALILLIIFITWQMIHFYAIGIIYKKDYILAKIPIFPAINKFSIIRKHIFIYILIFILSTYSLYFCSYTGYYYLLINTIIHIIWLKLFFQNNFTKYKNYKKLWGYKMFYLSIIHIIIFNFLISIDYIT